MSGSEGVDVAALLAEIQADPQFDDQGDDEWGSANLQPCGADCALISDGKCGE